jgi:hypothetical protein
MSYAIKLRTYKNDKIGPRAEINQAPPSQFSLLADFLIGKVPVIDIRRPQSFECQMSKKTEKTDPKARLHGDTKHFFTVHQVET